MKINQNILTLRQSEKVNFTGRSWMTIISPSGIEIVSDKGRWGNEESSIVKPKLLKINKQIHAVYDEALQANEKLEISAFIGIQPIKGNIYILDYLGEEEQKDFKGYMFPTDFVKLIKAMDNIMIPNYKTKFVKVSCFEFGF